MIKTVFIFHDCFIIKTPEAVLVFDYWKDADERSSLAYHLSDINPEMPLYFFVSHGHKDHFNRAIFEWSNVFRNARYILSKDVRRRINHIVNAGSTYAGTKVNPEKVITMRDQDVYEDEVIKVNSFPSTDIGNSYAVNICGKVIFHAGDLNAWIWKDESTEKEVQAELDKFNAILDIVASQYKRFDMAFFPVDSRIGTDYFIGAKIFLERFEVANFFPMHFDLGEDDTSICRLHRDAADFIRYASPSCHHYIMSAPDSSYAIH